MVSTIPRERAVPNLAFYVMSALEKLSTESLSPLKPDLPSFTSCNFKIGICDAVCILEIEFKEAGIPAGGDMDLDRFANLKFLIGSKRSFEELNAAPDLSEFFSWKKLLIVVDITSDAVPWAPVHETLVKWLLHIPVKRAEEINAARVKMALPEPPAFNISQVQRALWIIECDDTMSQGTAFSLTEVGCVTNDHVVSSSERITAFKADRPNEKFLAKVIKSNSVIDLAILNVVGEKSDGELKSSGKNVSTMDHVAVCGFPNYRVGDSGILSPGIIIGTRVVSGVQRMLTNAGIVAGMSGGPVLTSDNSVIGVCVTGAKNIQTTRDTEDQAIIPISALNLLE